MRRTVVEIGGRCGRFLQALVQLFPAIGPARPQGTVAGIHGNDDVRLRPILGLEPHRDNIESGYAQQAGPEVSGAHFFHARRLLQHFQGLRDKRALVGAPELVAAALGPGVDIRGRTVFGGFTIRIAMACPDIMVSLNRCRSKFLGWLQYCGTS